MVTSGSGSRAKKQRATSKPVARGRAAGSRSAAKSSAKPPSGKRKQNKAPARHYHPGPPITSEAALADALAALQARDPEVIGHMLEVGGPPPLRRREPGFPGLAWIVVSQQVSVASADAIHGRLAKAIEPLTPDTLLARTDEELAACGLSSPKRRTLRALAQALVDGSLDLAALAEMDAPDAHAALVAVHGIGPWTADIFLLFCLGHPDAWPAGDLALQEAARLALRLRSRPDARKLEKIGERWRPHRGVAARLLWAYYKVARGKSGMALAG